MSSYSVHELPPTEAHPKLKSGVEVATQTSNELNETVELEMKEAEPTVEFSSLRKYLILAVLSGAQFFDTFNASATISALPVIQSDLGFGNGTVQWMLSAYTLTFASFMLVSGRISDIFHPKTVFLVGFLVMGLLNIPIGASVNPIMSIVFRAVQGIGAAMNVPSAFAMITTSFRDPVERSKAYAIYNGLGSTASCLGFVIGGVISSKLSWRWIFYLLAIVVTSFSFLALLVLPKEHGQAQKRSLDLPGVGTITVGLILFVFAISEGGTAGWSSARVIAPLVLSILMIGAFLLIEKVSRDPALPSRTWTNKNFTPLFFYGWSIYWWVFSSQMQLVQVFINQWGDSSLLAALRCVPIGITGTITALPMGVLAPRIPRLVILIGGQALAAAGSALLALTDSEQRYWDRAVPGMIIGMLGIATSFVMCTIAVMEGVRKGEEGVVSAVMYTSYQVGATLGLAVVASITVGINGATEQFTGYAASFWSLLGLNGAALLIAAIFVRN